MALAATPGGENPSAAFLAGQQHGAQLAAQHRAAAAVAPKPPRPPRSGGGGGGQTLNDLLAQAQQIAQGQTNQQVAAIRAQQALYNNQAQDRATQMLYASQAAAKLLASLGLGDQTAKSYGQATQQLAGLAQGFSGQTQTDASNAADAVAAQAAQLGAPSGSVQTSTGQASDPAAVGNVLYGLGGFIPGNLLLTEGQTQAAQQRSLPANFLAYGNQMATGELAAGHANADTLTQNVLNARAQEPSLYQSILSSLGQQATNNALAQSLIGSRNVSGQVAQQNADTRKTQAGNSYTTAQQRQSNPDPSLSRVYGHVVDSHGNPILSNGKVIPVKSGSAAKTGKPLTFSQKKDATALASGIADGAFYGRDGKGKPAPKLTAQQAWDEMRKEGLLADPRTKALAAQAIIRRYGKGSNFLGGKPLSKKQKQLLNQILPLGG